MLLEEEGVGVAAASDFEDGRIEARRPGTGKKNFEVLPMAADGGGGGDGEVVMCVVCGWGCGGEVLGTVRERTRWRVRREV